MGLTSAASDWNWHTAKLEPAQLECASALILTTLEAEIGRRLIADGTAVGGRKADLHGGAGWYIGGSMEGKRHSGLVSARDGLGSPPIHCRESRRGVISHGKAGAGEE